MPCKESPRGVSQAKKKATAFQVEETVALLCLRKLQATRSRKQRRSKAKAGVSARTEETGARVGGPGIWSPGREVRGLQFDSRLPHSLAL